MFIWQRPATESQVKKSQEFPLFSHFMTQSKIPAIGRGPSGEITGSKAKPVWLQVMQSVPETVSLAGTRAPGADFRTHELFALFQENATQPVDILQRS